MAWNQTPLPPNQRHDGYVNMLNKYGTGQDNSTAYQYEGDSYISDMTLTQQYETGGLFAKIIDTPAEESVKHGFSLGLKGTDADEYIMKALDLLNWEENASWAIKASRLYGGALAVMLIDDGGDLHEPLNWKRIRDIEEIRVYERAVVWPDYTSLYNYGSFNQAQNQMSKFGMPEYYHVNSLYGQFTVHESRCMIFRNGILPERTMNPYYRFWGMPEYSRIHRELRETATTHSLSVKLLERSVQAIYSMNGLSSLLASDGGEDEVVKRLRTIDMARNLLNSIAIDNAGEQYKFESASMAGVKEVIDSTCNMLSAVTNIPQTILFGRSPAGMNATGQSDLENYYNYVEKIQRLMLKRNLNLLLDIIVCAGLHSQKLKDEPKFRLNFNPLWSMSEAELAQVETARIQAEYTKAQTAEIYVNMQALDPSEIRKGLAQQEEFFIEELLDETSPDDVEDDAWGSDEPTKEQPPSLAESTEPTETEELRGDNDSGETCGGVGIIVAKHIGGVPHVLMGQRSDNHLFGGPGGHIEPGETPEQAAIREAREEFNITLLNLKPLGKLAGLDAQYGEPFIFLCTQFNGEPAAGVRDDEMLFSEWRKPGERNGRDLFPPFAEALRLVNWENVDGLKTK